jgi:hypothetical protein
MTEVLGKGLTHTMQGVIGAVTPGKKDKTGFEVGGSPSLDVLHLSQQSRPAAPPLAALCMQLLSRAPAACPQEPDGPVYKHPKVVTNQQFGQLPKPLTRHQLLPCCDAVRGPTMMGKDIIQLIIEDHNRGRAMYDQVQIRLVWQQPCSTAACAAWCRTMQAAAGNKAVVGPAHSMNTSLLYHTILATHKASCQTMALLLCQQ